MNLLRTLFNYIGRALYGGSWIFLWAYLRRSSRAYIMLSCEGQILVVKNWLSDGRWHLPGGGIRKNETGREAALRELKEEVGVRASGTASAVTSGIWRTNAMSNRYEIFATSTTSKTIRPKWPEVVEAKWVDPQALTLATTPIEILDAVAKARSQNLLQ